MRNDSIYASGLTRKQNLPSAAYYDIQLCRDEPVSVSLPRIFAVIRCIIMICFFKDYNKFFSGSCLNLKFIKLNSAKKRKAVALIR